MNTLQSGDRVWWIASWGECIHGVVAEIRPNRILVQPDCGRFTFGKESGELVAEAESFDAPLRSMSWVPA